ncbi:GAP family protein [Nocardioides taihuensis]|uniref:GAP family protein n=1 Tax=Nocardioides taihuensis TaxID=1835606 RepID=A0ABW0BLP9_9ACTN
MYAFLEVLVYGLFATASALILAAVYVVIGGEHPRRSGVAFLTGFLFGTLLACLVALVVGQTFVDRMDAHDEVRAGLTVALGLALVVVGLRARSGAGGTDVTGSSRATAILAGLGNVGPAATFSMAGLLGFGGPKRLVLTFLAMGTVTAEQHRDVVDVTLVVVYLVVSSLLVAVPVGIVVVAGERAAVVLGRGQSWLTAHAAALRVYLSLGIGGLLVLDGLVRLVS